MSNELLTIIKPNKIFEKITEFIKERFPGKITSIKGNRISLNDFRYIKVTVPNDIEFTLTTYYRDKQESSINLPLKVHKYLWYTKIKDNLF
jgi:hypothetical protein